jgi:hypothetical protein
MLSEVVALFGALRAARSPMTAAQRSCAAGQVPQHVDVCGPDSAPL